MASGARASALCFTLSLVLWFCVLIRAQETTTELPTTTPLPDGNQQATVGWVGNPKRRGTLSLLIECLTTIFACTWTVLHLNVPAITDSTTTRVLRKAKWMAITVLFPEFIFAKAVCELRFALEMLDWISFGVHYCPNDFQTVSEMKINGRSAWVLWAWTVEFERLKRILFTLLMWVTPLHSYHSRVPLAGKVVREGKTFIEKSFSEKDRHRDGSAVLRVQKWTLSHAYYANMGGIVARKRMYEFTADNKESFLTHLYSVVRGDHLAGSFYDRDPRAGKLGHPLKELRLSEDDIKDKSKADWIVKTIAVIQIARLIFDLVTRGVGGQPVTQLEIATASFSVFAIVTYLVNWWKPKDVSRPTMIDTVIDEGAKGDVVRRTTEPFFARLWCPTPPLHRYQDSFSARDRIRNDELWSENGMFLSTWVLMATSCLVFGGIHCIAWSFQFPTQVEEVAWRIAALVSTGLPILALAGSFAILQYRPRNLKRKLAEAVEETSRRLSCRGGTALTTWNIDDDWWKAFTTAVSTRAIKLHPEENMFRGLERLKRELHMMINLDKSVQTLIWGTDGSSRHEGHHLTTVWNIARELKTSAGQDFALRGEYEKWERDISSRTHPSLDTELGTHSDGAPKGMFQWFFSRCAEEPASVQSYEEAKKVWDIQAQRLLRVLNISSGIIYTAARLVLFGIMFSSLRAVPDGVYDTANWTRFVPSFS